MMATNPALVARTTLVAEEPTAGLANDTGSSSSDGITMADALQGTADAHSAIAIYNGTHLRPGEAGRLRIGQHPQPAWRRAQSVAAAG
jgi:hypothetical protein